MSLTELISEFSSNNNLPESFTQTAEQHFVRLAYSIHQQATKLERPLILGINGCQGSGKSTLTEFLKFILNEFYNCSSVGMSIDDFYLTRAERLVLSEEVHPLFKTRGVPGTHDTALIEQTFKRLNLKQIPMFIPLFNKAIDDRLPLEHWATVNKPVKVILFEGWCVGVHSETESSLNIPVNKLEEGEDPECVWRKYVNDILATEYAPIFKTIDRLVMLKAPGFYAVKRWRHEQEQKLLLSVKARDAQATRIMTEPEIERFIQHYQRITENTLQQLPEKANDLFELDEDRVVQRVVIARGVKL